MNKIFIVLLLFGVLPFGFSSKVMASHTLGGDITYKSTATPGVYEVTLAIFRDCWGVTLCSGGCGSACTMTMDVKGVDSGYTSTSFGTFTVSLVSVRDANINLECPSAKNTCTNMGCVASGTYTPGIERYEFKGLVNIGSTSTIPASCCNVRFTWELCCRSFDVQTGSAGQNLYLEAVINRCHSVSSGNSSPIFTSEPRMAICGGMNYVENISAVDPDHDSLSYAFAPALQGFASPVTYTSPFAYNKPMPWSGNATGLFPAGIHCDAETGDIMFTPGNLSGSNFYGVMAYEVKQWKTISGTPTVIGTTRRDVQMVILGNCPPNNSPRFITNPPDGLNPNAPKTKWEICAGEQLCFTFTAKDTDFLADPVPGNPPLVSDTTYLSIDSTMLNLGATFVRADSSRQREDAYQFCWTPNDSLARSNPYYFTISAKDSRCPNPGRLARTFSVKVRGLADLSIQKQNTKCGSWSLGYTNNKPTLIPSTVSWWVSTVPNDYSMSQSPITSTSQTPFAVSFKHVGKYLVILEASTPGPNGIPCARTFYDTIVVDTLIKAMVRDTFTCSGSSIQISAAGKWGAAPYSYRWYNSIKDTSLTALNAPNFSIPSYSTPVVSAARYYTVQVRDIDGCKAFDSIKVIHSTQLKSFTKKATSCWGSSDGSVTIQMADSVFPFQYKLDSGVYQSSNVFTGLKAGTYTLSVKDSGLCENTSNMFTIIQPSILRDTLTRVTPESCYDSKNAIFQTYGVGGTLPYWYSMDSVSFFSSNVFDSLAPGTYQIHIRDSSGCNASVSQTITATDSLTIAPVVTDITCNNGTNGNILLNVSGGTRPYTYKFGNSAFVADSNYRNRPAGMYPYTVKDSKQCQKSDSVYVTEPSAIIVSADVVAVSCFGGNDGSVLLSVSGGVPPYKYRQGTGAYVSTPLFEGLSAGTYSYTIMDSLLCTIILNKTITQPAVAVQGSVAITHPITCFDRADGGITVTAINGRSPYLYSINSGTYTSANIFNQLGSGTYRFAVKDSSGCKDTSMSVVLNSPPQIVAPAITGSNTVNLRDTQTYSVTPQAGLFYLWGVQNGMFYGNSNSSLVNVRWTSMGIGSVQVVLYTDSTCSDSSSLDVTIGNTAIGELTSESSGIKMYPNPVTHTLNVSIEKLVEGNRIQLFDINGRMVYDQVATTQQSISMDGLASGMYLLRVGNWQQKVVKE